MLMVVFASASTGLLGAALLAPIDLDTDYGNISVGLQIAYDWLYMVAALFLNVFAILMKMSVKSDTVRPLLIFALSRPDAWNLKITSIVVFGVTPLLKIYAISELILTLLSNLVGDLDGTDYDLAATVTCGTLYFVVLCLLVFCLLRVWLWDGPREHVMPPSGGGYPVQQMPYLRGMQPVAQVLRHLGFTGQQPQSVPQGYPSPNSPYQVHHGHGPLQCVNGVYNQQPYVGAVPSPASEVKEEALTQNKPSPPPES